MKKDITIGEKRIYAPVVIPTCNRYPKLKECIESLANCSYAKETEVYISVDYPPNENYILGWKKVKEYVRNIQGFKKVNFWILDYNLGPSRNSMFIQEKAFEKYDFLISTEDDNVFAPAFLDYMNKMLQRFEKDPYVLAIAGFSMSNLHYTSKIYKNYAFQPWGNGKWKKKWYYLRDLNQSQLFEKYSKNFFKIGGMYLKNKWLFCVYISCLLSETKESELTDAILTILFYLCGYYSIFPTKSLVRNKGFDGSGENCKEGAVPFINEVELDKELLFEYDSLKRVPIYKKWYLPLPKWVKKSSKLGQDPLAWLLYCAMGKERYKEWRKKKGI